MLTFNLTDLIKIGIPLAIAVTIFVVCCLSPLSCSMKEISHQLQSIEPVAQK